MPWRLLQNPTDRAAATGDNKHGPQAALLDSVKSLVTLPDIPVNIRAVAEDCKMLQQAWT